MSRRASLTSLAALLATWLAAAVVPTGALPQAQGAQSTQALAALHGPVLPGLVAGYPRHTELAEPETDDGDPALRPGLTAYHQIAPRLNALQRSSDRVSAEVIGTSAGGRDIYLATLTAPETAAQSHRQSQLLRRILTQPQQAVLDPTLAHDYKVPVVLNANIHGDEREGTDAVLELLEEYATSTDAGVERLLATTRIFAVISMNPDGRTGNTRPNDAGFDLNRDFITASQPETQAVRDLIVRAQPLLLLDLHGYVNGTLVEPTTPPHGQDIEADLLLRHTYSQGLDIEQAILDLGYDATDGVRPPQIPYRDWQEGWDGWPPIFTPQYAALHGVAAATVELPLRTNASSYRLPIKELRRRARINIDVARAAIDASLGYAVTHHQLLVADHLEWARRGLTGAEQVPLSATDLPGAGAEDVYRTDYPRGYLIPVGAGQRSASAAARLVDHLVANGVEVTRATSSLRVSGRDYPPGSYLVDLRQARRGVAGAILGPGTDVSSRVSAMYDIAGWSLASLWGADVVTVPEPAALPTTGPRVLRAEPTGQLRGSGPWQLELLDPEDVAALADLIEADVELTWTDRGAVVVPPAAAPLARRVVREHGVALSAAETTEGAELETLQIAAAASAAEQWALQEMGLNVTAVSTESLNEGFDWTGVDTLYVASGLQWDHLEESARADLTAYLAGGGGLVARGATGTDLNEALEVLDVTAKTGPPGANGVVDVEVADTPIVARATPQTFVYDPRWFTDLGPQVVVDQRYAGQHPLVSGHWRSGADGAGGPTDAAGQPLIVHGIDREGPTAGAAVVLLGNEPLFRAHPKGQYALVARALIWSSLQG